MTVPLMYLIQSLFISLCGVVPIVRSQESHFTNPSRDKNRVWALGDVQVISWETTLSVFNLTIWQEDLVEDGAFTQGNIYSKVDDDAAGVSDFSWVVQLYDFDLASSNVFFFWVNPDGPDGFTSPYFNITAKSKSTTKTTAKAPARATAQPKPKPKPTATAKATTSTKAGADKGGTTSTETSAGTATATTTGATAIAIDPSSTTGVDASATDIVDTYANNAANLSPPSSSSTSASSTEESSTELSTTEKIALGVGIGIGVPVLAALFALVWLKVRSSNNSGQTAAESDTIHLTKPVAYAQPNTSPSSREVKGSDPREYYSELPIGGKESDSGGYYSGFPKEVKGTDPSDFYPELPGN